MPEWVLQSHWHCLTRTAEEVSVVCEASAIPAFDREAGEDWLSHILTVPYEWIIEWEGHCIGVARLTLTESDNPGAICRGSFRFGIVREGIGHGNNPPRTAICVSEIEASPGGFERADLGLVKK